MSKEKEEIVVQNSDWKLVKTKKGYVLTSSDGKTLEGLKAAQVKTLEAIVSEFNRRGGE